MALAIAELLLVPMFLANKTSDSAAFTTNHILVFHEVIFYRSPHRNIETGIDSARILLEESGFDKSHISALDALDVDVKYTTGTAEPAVYVVFGISDMQKDREEVRTFARWFQEETRSWHQEQFTGEGLVRPIVTSFKEATMGRKLGELASELADSALR